MVIKWERHWPESMARDGLDLFQQIVNCFSMGPLPLEIIKINCLLLICAFIVIGRSI